MGSSLKGVPWCWSCTRDRDGGDESEDPNAALGCPWSTSAFHETGLFLEIRHSLPRELKGSSTEPEFLGFQLSLLHIQLVRALNPGFSNSHMAL